MYEKKIRMGDCMAGKKAKVMVVDDNRDFVKLTRMVLEKSGYETAGAYSGKQCMDSLEAEKPDVLLLDIMMPGSVTARGVVDYIKGNDEGKKMKVIYLTGVKASEKQMKELVESGYVADFIEKPVEPAELMKRIEIAITGKKGR